MWHQNVSSLRDYELVSGGCSFMTDGHTPRVHVNISLFHSNLSVTFLFILSFFFQAYASTDLWPPSQGRAWGCCVWFRLLWCSRTDCLCLVQVRYSTCNLPSPHLQTSPHNSPLPAEENERKMVVMINKQSHNRDHTCTQVQVEQCLNLERWSKSWVPCSAVVRSHRPTSALDHQIPPALEPGAA